MTLQKRFLVLGCLLFLFGLISGLLTIIMENPRMGLSAHMQGITNGVFLISIGAAWQHFTLSPKLSVLTFYLLAYGAVANWLATTLAALWGTGQMTPIHAPNPSASQWQEQIVSLGLITLTAAMIVGSVLLVVGLLRKP